MIATKYFRSRVYFCDVKSWYIVRLLGVADPDEGKEIGLGGGFREGVPAAAPRWFAIYCILHSS